MFLGQPLTIAFGFHAGAVDQQVQGTSAGPVGDVDGQGLLATAKRAEVRHRTVEPGKLKQARHHPGGLPKRQAEERLQRQTRLDRGVGEHRLTATPAGRRSKPLRLGIEPDRQRSAPRQRSPRHWARTDGAAMAR
jgi:hypothetical protein